MGILSRITSGPSAGAPEIARTSSAIADNEKTGPAVADTPVDSNGLGLHKDIKSVPAQDSDDDDELVHKDMQTGVQKIEAMAQVWPRWALYMTYAW